jgi:hypothetical protein
MSFAASFAKVVRHKPITIRTEPTMSENIPRLRAYLTNLPESSGIPYPESSSYNFATFEPDQDWVEDVGLEGAVNRELEVRLGSRANGGLTFRERGPGLTAVVDVLEKYLNMFPASILLSKWVTDLVMAAQNIYRIMGIPVS